MEKPKKITITKEYYDYYELKDYIQKKYNVDLRDYANSHKHFPNYLKKYNLDPPNYPSNHSDKFWLNGKEITKERYDEEFAKIHKQYKEYQDWCRIEGNERPPYLDFWHWLMENQLDSGSISNGCYIYLNISTNEKYPDWINEIFKMYQNEFSDMTDEENCIYCWLEW